MDENQKVATVRYTLAINNDANTVLSAGAVKIKVPSYIFKGWYGNTKINLVYSYNFDPNVKWQLPEAPAKSTVSDFNYTDNGDRTYTVSNFKPV